MLNTIGSNKPLPYEHWIEFFDRFSGDRHQQYVSIKNISLEFGDKALIGYSSLMAMSYVRDPQGDRLVITVTKEQLVFTHTIYSPTEVSIKQRPNGDIIAVWIRDAAGTKTSIRLQTSDLSFCGAIERNVIDIIKPELLFA